ncbi:MAG TPA: hypothetical protein VFA83_12175 [Acidimicrobiales bacterium]|nr:hypothetical protein [Acidimicrobiales bacterium]
MSMNGKVWVAERSRDAKTLRARAAEANRVLRGADHLAYAVRERHVPRSDEQLFSD